MMVMIVVVATHGAALACQCGTRYSPREATTLSRVVFTGEVLAVEDEFSTLEKLWLRMRRWFDPAAMPPMHRSGKYCLDYGMKVTFKVEEVWKGQSTRRITLRTGRSGGDCGFEFEVGTRYLVYVRADSPNGCDTDICTRTAPIGKATEDLAYFRNVKKPGAR
jgi:hypothetical protein